MINGSQCPSCGNFNDYSLNCCNGCGQQIIVNTSVALDKATYQEGEKIVATVTGITPAMQSDRAFLAVYKAGAAHNDWGVYQYPTTGYCQLTFTNPLVGGSYEMRLYRRDGQYDDSTLAAKAYFTVAGATDDAVVIELDKSSYDPSSQIVVTTKNISGLMQQERAFLAVYKAGAAHRDWGAYQYPTAGYSQMTFTAPADRGSYEMRLYRRDGQYDDSTLVKTKPFCVGGASPAGNWTCSTCGRNNPAGTNFCGGCGSKPTTTGNCPACGTALAPGVRFCGSCGNQLG